MWVLIILIRSQGAFWYHIYCVFFWNVSVLCSKTETLCFVIACVYEACIGVLGIQDICHFTSRDIGYFSFYFQGYGILCSISGILLFFHQNIQIQSRNTNNINKNHFRFSTKEEKLYVQDMASLSRPGP